MRKVLFILGGLADSDVDWLVAHGTRRTCPPGTVLIHEGRPIEELFIVLDGRLSVTLAAGGGAEIARLGAGEVLGELSFLDSRPPAATVTAIETAAVLGVPRVRLEEKLREDAAFAARFYRALGVFLASRLRQSQQRLGYGAAGASGEEVGEELDPGVLDGIALAGARFEWLLRRLRQGPGADPGGDR
jgi:bacteriocin-type transport-associated protein